MAHWEKDTGDDRSTEGTKNGEIFGSIAKEPPSPPLEKSQNRREDGHDQDAIRESPEASQIDEGGEQAIKQDTTAGTRWRGGTQLAGKAEEVATETTYGEKIAAYAEPTLAQIHDQVLDAVSGQMFLETSCGPGEVTAFIGNIITTIALQARAMAILARDYNITILARMEPVGVSQAQLQFQRRDFTPRCVDAVRRVGGIVEVWKRGRF
ncbi:hypothetical protein B9Z19DRAFT_1126138 [Tuber borchii]|uniref:Uncharacterized protein n=1 Tax=Tuber borchii TaxID=42251 RepID=A0A2T6ZTI3_TUBBO|nr:hypothetical protein B9Z19DRAFT_1126138 [Tuber borchii]